MAVHLRCPDCKSTFKVADADEGDRVECTECGYRFRVTVSSIRKSSSEAIRSTPPASARRRQEEDDDGDDIPRRRTRRSLRAEKDADIPRRRRPIDEDDDMDAPRRRRRPRYEDDEDDEPRRRPRRARARDDEDELSAGTKALPWILGGVVGVLALVGIVVVLIIVNQGSNKEQAPGDEVVKAKLPALNPGDNQPLNVQPLPRPNPRPRPAPRPNPFVRPKPKPEPKPEPARIWKNIKADPLPDALKSPADPGTRAMGLPLGHDVVFPTTSSPFMVVGRISSRDVLTILNLYTGAKVAVFGNRPGLPKRTSLRDMCLSPDGKYLAGKAGFPKKGLEIWFCSAPQKFQSIPTKDRGFLRFFDFAGPGEFFTVSSESLENILRVYAVENGRELRSFKLPHRIQSNKYALSPGRRYLAYFDDNCIHMIDLKAAKLVGQSQKPTSRRGTVSTHGIGFSPDGSRISVLSKIGEDRIITWKIDDGSIESDFEYPGGLESGQPRYVGRYYNRTFAWLADGSGWFACRHLFIDAATGKRMTTLPDIGSRNNERHVRGNAVVEINRLGKKLAVVPIPQDKLVAAKKAIKEGIDQADNYLPKPSEADWTDIKKLPDPDGPVAWTVEAQAALQPGRLGSVQLVAKTKDIEDIHFSRSDAGKAAVVSFIDTLKGETIKVDIHQLQNGAHIGSYELFFCHLDSKTRSERDRRGFINERKKFVISDISPDATRFVCVDPKSKTRVDLWNFEGPKTSEHIVGWLPYAKEPEKVEWVGHIDADHVLTASTGGKLVLWKVPECKAVYAINKCKSPFAVSPTRKYVAAFAGESVQIIEALTGKHCGHLPTPGSNVEHIAFRRDGKAVAVVARSKVFSWDLADGKLTNSFETERSMYGPVNWAGKDYLTCGSELVSLNLKAHLWSYRISGGGTLRCSDSPDGLHWFVSGTVSVRPGKLSRAIVPDPQAMQVDQLVAAGRAAVLFGKGSSIRVQLQVGDVDANEIMKQIAENLKRRGITVSNDASIVLALSGSKQAGKVLTYSDVGGFGRNRRTVRVDKYVCNATLTDQRHGVLWKTTQDVTFRPSIVRTERGKTLQTKFDQGLTGSLKSWLTHVAPPGTILSLNGKPLSLPGHSLLRALP